MVKDAVNRWVSGAILPAIFKLQTLPILFSEKAENLCRTFAHDGTRRQRT